jgi:hypothetical protein
MYIYRKREGERVGERDKQLALLCYVPAEKKDKLKVCVYVCV